MVSFVLRLVPGIVDFLYLSLGVWDEIDAGAEIWYIMYTSPMLTCRLVSQECRRESYTSELGSVTTQPNAERS